MLRVTNMVKRMRACGLALAVLWAASAFPQGRAVEAVEEPEVSAQSAVLISADDGTVLYEKDAHQQRAMASTTKIMTALLVLEEAERSGDPVIEITEEMVRVEGSSMGLMPGDRLTLTNLTAGMLLASGNDAANAAALHLAGSQEGFAEQMNARAQEIGMVDSHFVTPSGLDEEEHYSTAYDMALLAREALGNPEFARIAGSSTLQADFLEPEKKVSYTNHNKLLRIYEGCVGVKTGFTKKAGRCLVSAAQREGTTLIAVTLNAPDDWTDHTALLDYGFSTVRTLTFGEGCPEELPLVGGFQDTVPLRAGEPIKATLSLTDAQKVESRLLLPPFLYAPVREGEQVGRIQYLAGDQEIYSVPVFAGAGAEAYIPQKPSRWQSIWQWLQGLFSRR